jgi:hypothetical protein
MFSTWKNKFVPMNINQVDFILGDDQSWNIFFLLTNYIWVMSFEPWKSQNDWTQWCWTWFLKQITSLFMCTSKGWVLWVTSLEERDVYQLLCKVSSLTSIVAKGTQNLQQWNMLLHHWLLMLSHVWFTWQYVCM